MIIDLCSCVYQLSYCRFSDIFWIDASSESAIDLRLKQIAKANSAPPEAISSAAHALTWISRKSNWLMIYDNADGGYQVVEKFLPPGNRGNILITSRNYELCRITEDSMEVIEMEEEEGLSLLYKSAQLNNTSEDVQILAKQLLSKLGGIPLAIDQAGAYMVACRCPLEDYLELYTKNHNQLMDNPSFKGASNYGSSTYETWEISMKEIEAQAANGVDSRSVAAKSAASLFKIIAFLHHENIPEELFKFAAENYKKRDIDEEQKLGLSLSVSLLDPNVLFLNKRGEWDIIQFQLGMQVLLSFSLLKKIGKMYSVHALVNCWNRSRIPDTEINKHISITRAMLACSVVLDYYYADNYKFCGLLAPHISANYDHAVQLSSSTVYCDDECERFTLVLHHIGSWNKAEELQVQAIKAREEKLGSHHPHTLISIANLACTYQAQGRWDAAEKLLVQVMDARKEKPDLYLPDTLRDMNHLAVAYWGQGRWDEAEKLQVEVMEARKEGLGDLAETLMNAHNLANTYVKQGRWDEAEMLQVQVIEGNREALGSHHPDTLTSVGNLAVTYQNQGRWDEAEKLQVQIMEASKEKFGSHHPDTLRCMANLTVTYQYQGRWDEAEKLMVPVIEGNREALGSHHPETLKSMANLSSTYKNQGRWDEAEKLQVQVIEARTEKLGSNHPDTLKSMGNLALTYRSQGRWDEAEKLQVQVMEASKAKFGSDHPDTLITMANLAVTYSDQGKWDEAEKLQVQHMETMKEKLGSCHPDTLTSMANLAFTYSGQGRLDEADLLFAQAIMLMEETMGSQHPTTIHFLQLKSRIASLRPSRMNFTGVIYRLCFFYFIFSFLFSPTIYAISLIF